MAAATLVPLTASVLAWAIAESGLSTEQVAERTKVQPKDVANWLDGTLQPTKTEFARLVDALHRPSALFFLAEPPAPQVGALAFRGPARLDHHVLSVDERRAVVAARRYQELLRWIREKATLLAVDLPSLTLQQPAEEAAASARMWIGITVAEQLGWASGRAAFDAWRNALERHGLLVFLYELSRTGIRAFSLPNESAPIIGLNTAFNDEARIFSLMHELGHLMTGSASACIGFSSPGSRDDELERWCESFAADLLLPARAVREQLRLRRDLSLGTVAGARRAVAALSRSFRVSQRAMALRLIHLDIAPRSLYARVDQEATIVDFPKRQTGGTGQTRPQRRIERLGPRVPSVVLDAASRGLITYRDALDYLQVDTGEAAELEELLAAASR